MKIYQEFIEIHRIYFQISWRTMLACGTLSSCTARTPASSSRCWSRRCPWMTTCRTTWDGEEGRLKSGTSSRCRFCFPQPRNTWWPPSPARRKHLAANRWGDWKFWLPGYYCLSLSSPGVIKFVFGECRYLSTSYVGTCYTVQQMMRDIYNSTFTPFPFLVTCGVAR